MNNITFSRYLSIIVVIISPILFSLNAAANDKGKTIYEGTCQMCHKTGVMGAPKFSDKNDWAKRIAKGKDTLYQHALHGFKGEKGTMPAKGGNSGLSDEAVKAAVDYFIANVK